MIGYVTIGSNDFDRAAKFYDALCAELGGKRFFDLESFIAWGNEPNTPMIALVKPYDGKAATVGNGVMVGLAASSKEHVDKVYAKAISWERATKVRRVTPGRLSCRVFPRPRRQQAQWLRRGRMARREAIIR